MPDSMTGADVDELENLDSLVRSRAWKIVRNLMNDHRIYCVGESHSFLKRHEDRKAGEWLARSQESSKLLSLVKDRINELQNKQKGE